MTATVGLAISRMQVKCAQTALQAMLAMVGRTLNSVQHTLLLPWEATTQKHALATVAITALLVGLAKSALWTPGVGGV